MAASHDSPEAAEAAFYLAFARVDLDLMKTVWSSAHPVACIHPGGGPRLGRQAVIQSWAEIFSGTHPPRLEQRLIGRMESPGLRVHLVEELIRSATDPDAAPSLVVATNVYARDEDGWRMTLHHASLPMVPARDKGAERQLH